MLFDIIRKIYGKRVLTARENRILKVEKERRKNRNEF